KILINYSFSNIIIFIRLILFILIPFIVIIESISLIIITAKIIAGHSPRFLLLEDVYSNNDEIFWEVTIIINLISTNLISRILKIRFSFNNSTLNRFFSFHFILLFIILLFIIFQLFFLHLPVSSNLTGINRDLYKIPFHPFTFKDLLGFNVILYIFLLIILQASLEEYQERDSEHGKSLALSVSPCYGIIYHWGPPSRVNKLNPLHAGCHIEVPRERATKRAVINVRTMDNACFAVIAALYPAKSHMDRKSSYPHYTTVLNLADIEFLITFKDISEFEHGIKNLSRLIRSQITRKKNKKFFCDRYVADTTTRLPCRILSYVGRTPNQLHFVQRFSALKISYPPTCLWKCCLNSNGRRTVARYHGRYRSLAYLNCNLNYKNSFYIPIFHNLSGYDAHFIIKEIAIVYNRKVDVLLITKEKYISFTKYIDSTKDKNGKNFQKNDIKLRFIDSFKFLNTSFDELVSYLDKDKLKIVCFEFCKLNAEDFDLLTRKDVFPYEYIDCVEKLQNTRLPPRELFFVRFELLTDIDVVIFIERDIHGGLSQYSGSIMCATNNKYIVRKIMYSDMDSLIYHIECDDVYKNMIRDIARFNTSYYPADNVYDISLANKKIPAKMYAMRVDGKKDTKKAKTITFDDYTRCLNEEIEMIRRQSCIRSKLYEVYTISESKIALSPYDDKRYVIPDSTKTLPWGHWRISL
ncbi:Cytochrome b, partial [Atta colombica]